MKLIIFTITYSLLSPLYVFADVREELAGTADAGWVGPLSAVVIITGAIFVAKKMKNTNEAPEASTTPEELIEDNK